ncbi:CUE domain-containing protein 2 isoform X1 [Rhodnius prolixus]|uniref:CUE domain-containing protein 2 isoform X1 n=1 Tax=Rhodnius prolixus TaxID=13249 RepID=UPI003D18F325
MNKSIAEEKEEIVKESLFKFLMQHIPSAQISTIDEIVLSYVVRILEELGEETADEIEGAFDAEGFCEMMAAYFPEFATISLPKVCQWMFELEGTLRKTRDNSDSFIERDLSELLVPIALSRTHNSSSECSSTGKSKSQRKHQLSEASDGSCSSDSSGEYYAHEDINDYEQIQVLQEMFPGLCDMEVRHCLTIAGGDIATAAQLVLHRQEAGQTLNHSSILQHAGQPKAVVDDQELKSRIIARYSFVDKDDDAREHRPVAPKSEPKKLVRYRDNKIVSLKGERFTEIKKDDEEDTKKNTGGIKPPRQNKYH